MAALGVVLALVSLGWNAWSFLLSGSRVTVEVRAGMRRGDALATTNTAPTSEEITHLRAQGFTDRVLAVVVSNSGRGSTSVRSVDLLYPQNAALGNAFLEPSLPHRLEGESEQTWYFDFDLAERYAKALEQTTGIGSPCSVRGRVERGGKKEPVISDNEIRVL